MTVEKSTKKNTPNMLGKVLPFISGCFMSINFIIFWAVPIAGMGGAYKAVLKPVLKPLYDMIDTSPSLRYFATNYIYTKPEHADFFAMSLLLIVNCIITLSTLFYWQLTTGSLPFWLIALYYCSWVGIGGSMMGTAYGMAHKEGHFRGLYKQWIRDYVGHFFENVLGVFFGNVPWSFTTSHICVHHKVDGGVGDTFYEWDLDRSSLAHFMLYVHRVFLHMIGYSSLRFLDSHGLTAKADLLRGGIKTYAFVAVLILALTRSPSFLFWVYLEPLLCMCYFLALINIGFHGFIEFDEQGRSIPTVNSSTIVEGEDDFFGEDDHMAHHYHTSVYFRDLPAHQASKVAEFQRTRASVFRKLSIVELSIFIVLGLWDKLADHYVDYSGAMTREQIKDMLRTRAQRLETSNEKYEAFLANPSNEARKALLAEIQATHTPEAARRSSPTSVAAASRTK